MGGIVSSNTNLVVDAAPLPSWQEQSASGLQNCEKSDTEGQHPSQPVVDINQNSKLKNDVVIVAIDGSLEAEIAFKWYLAHVHRPEHRVIVLHCNEVDPPSGKHMPDYAVPPEAWVNKVEVAEKRGMDVLLKYKARLEESKVNGEVCSQWGRPGPAVVESARRLQANMVIVGSRGMGLLRRTVLGSVSHYVVQHSPVPVTVVPKPQANRWWWF